MNYIRNTAQGAIIYQKTHTNTHKRHSNLTVIKKLCVSHLFTYQGYLSAVKECLKMSYKVPIYMSEAHQWIALENIRCYENIWINMANVETTKRHHEGTQFVFFDTQTLCVKNKYEHILSLIEKLSAIRAYKVKHFQ